MIRSLCALSVLAISPAMLVAQDTTNIRTIDTLVVTAERRVTPTTATPAVVRVITSEEWRDKGAGDLTTLLREIPGLQLDPVVGSGTGISVQGLGSDRVQILIDGAPVEGRLNNQFDLTRLDPAQFDRVEIVEGPQSTLYGSTALGGVINLITRAPDGTHQQVTTQGGTYGQFDVNGSASTRVGVTGLSATAGHRHIDIVPGNAVGTPGSADRWDLSAALLQPLGSSLLDVRAMHSGETQKYQALPGPGADFGNAAANAQTDMLAALRINGDGTEVRLHASVYDHTLNETDQTSQITTTDPQAQRVADAELIQRMAFAGAKWVAGLRGEHEWLTSARLTAADISANTGAAYASAEWGVGSAVDLSAGARLTVAQRWGSDLSPRLGLVVHGAHGLYGKVSTARGFRAPSFTEQFSDFVNPEAFYAVNGNPDLRPETSWNVTAELGTHLRQMQLYVRGYDNQLRNFIEPDLTGQNGEISEFTYLNVVKAQTAGGELGGSVRRGVITVEGSYAYLDARDETNDQPLLGRAKHTVRGAVSVAHAHWNASVEGIRASALPISQDMGTGALIYEGATPRVNLRAGLVVLDEWHLNAGVDNVGNVVPLNALGGFGRRYFAGLTWSR